MCICNIFQSAHVTGGGRRGLSVLLGVPVSVTLRLVSVPAGQGWWVSSVMSVRMDTGTWTVGRGVSPAAVIQPTPLTTSVTR